MRRPEEQGIIDLSALRMREATFTAGAWLTYVLVGVGALYLALTWQQPNRLALAGLFGAGLLTGVLLPRLPRERIVHSRYREIFFLTWSFLDLVLITLATLADGGTASPIALFFFVPVTFAAATYPLSSVAVVGGMSVFSYLTLAITVGNSNWGNRALFTVVLICTGAMSAWQARNQDRQREALTEASRADPLTGSLNRRGFEERASADISAASRECRQGAVLVLDIDHFKRVNDRHGHAAGDELLCWVVQTLERVIRPTDAVGRLGGDEFAVLFPEIDPADALKSAARIQEALCERAPSSVGLATFPLDGTELEELKRWADIRLYASRHDRSAHDHAVASERLSWAATLAHTVDVRMDASHEHSRAVADWAVAIAADLGWHAELLGMLRIAAMLHDVGKTIVPDRILSKPGPLNPDELATIREHADAGAQLVSRIEGLDAIVPWIRHSHEHFDGTGYPDGLRGEEIPDASRILLVADAFDAMLSSRPYSAARSVSEALEELRRGAGSQFDPACVQALITHITAGPVDDSTAAPTRAHAGAASAGGQRREPLQESRAPR